MNTAMTLTKTEEAAYDSLREAGQWCAWSAANRWGSGFRLLTQEQREAEVARVFCGVLFGQASDSRAYIRRTWPALQDLLPAGTSFALSPAAQHVMFTSAISARETTWGVG